jgi:hypothetical protein
MLHLHDDMLLRCGRQLSVSHNLLDGEIPAGWSRFNEAALDYNCLDNCSFLRAPSCMFPFSNASIGALSAFFNATGGGGWLNASGWTPLPPNPCDGSVFGVVCGQDRVRCEQVVRLVTVQYYSIPCEL